MAKNKTQETNASVDGYLAAIKGDERRKDCQALADLMSNVTNEAPRMWGTSIVGFGTHQYKYESGREGEICIVGFSSRKGDISVYGLNASSSSEALFTKLGKHKLGKGCLYIKRLSDIDLKILQKLIANAIAVKKSEI
jgi:hypothetical protein